MKLIIQDFLNTQSFDSIPNNATTNLLYILQIIMKRLLENQKRTQKKLENQIKINKQLRIKIHQQNSDDSGDEYVKDIMSETVINKSKMPGVICPVCLNCYTSLKYLDRHFFTHHCELSDLWQILRTPHYSGITADPTIKLIATSAEKSQLKQTIQFLGEEVILEQRDNDMKIKDYFRKKLMKVNNKLDQISLNMTQKSFDNYTNDRSHSKKNSLINENNSITSKTDSNKYNSSNNNFTNIKSDYDFDTGPKSSSEVEGEIVIHTNSNSNNNNSSDNEINNGNNFNTNNNNFNNTNNNNFNNPNNNNLNNTNNNNFTNNNNNFNGNINMNNTNFTTSTNVFVISDSTITENDTEIKNKNFSTPKNSKTNSTSLSSYQLSPSNLNSTPNTRIESNMFPMTNSTFTNSTNLRTISEESTDDDRPIKQTKIKSRRRERVKKAVLETDSSAES